MPGPFPGMDPYLQTRSIWPDLHRSLIGAIRDGLAPEVGPNYYACAERRTYIAQVEPDPRLRRPDVAVMAVAVTLPGERSEGRVVTLAPPIMQTVTLPQWETIREGYIEIMTGCATT